MDAPLLHSITDALSQEVGHPLRRGNTGPSDVEWALLVQKVDGMERALKNLTEEIKSSNVLAIERCKTCANAGTLKDHEDRIRTVEKFIWKAMGLAAVGASLLSFFLNKVFK